MPQVRHLLLILLLGVFCSPRVQSREVAPGEIQTERKPPVRVALAKVIERDFSGLDYGEIAQGDLMELRRQAKGYIQLRRGKLPSVEQAAFVTHCAFHPATNPFCPYIVQPEILLSEEERTRLQRSPAMVTHRRSQKKASLEKAAEHLKEGSLSSFDEQTAPYVYRALKGFSNWEQFRKSAEEASGGRSCLDSRVLAAIGLKAEEFFPEETAIETALKTYARVDRCADERDPEGEKARFRLGLIQVWRNRCDVAAPLFEKIASNPESQYLSRSLYWVGRCAQKTGNRLKLEITRNRIVKVNPIGYHSLSLNQENAFRIVALLNADAPQVQFRTQKKPAINRDIEAIEMLAHLGEYGAAQKILKKMQPEIIETESEFQMYFAVLANRVRDPITQFQVTADVMAKYPSMISEETMKLFYPLKKYREIWRNQKNIDPYLALALIRQESGFLAHARSRVGALGLMQLMPETARRIQRVSKRQLLRPEVNLRLGLKYLLQMVRRFDGDAELALAAYNAGPQNVEAWRKRYPIEDKMLFLDMIPFGETRNYVSLITRNYYWYLNLYRTQAIQLQDGRGRSVASSHANNPVVFPAFSEL